MNTVKELLGKPARRPLEDYDQDVLNLAQSVSDLKHRCAALQLDMEHANRQLAIADGKVTDREAKIHELETRLTNAMMRLAEAATHIKQMAHVANAAETAMKFVPRPRIETDSEGAAEIAAK